MQSVLEADLTLGQLENEVVLAAKPVSISLLSGQGHWMRSALAGKGEVSALWTRGKGAGKCVGRRSWVKRKAAIGVG